MTAKRLLVIVTGLSGSGLGSAINVLEDAGNYCIDNLPFRMIQQTLDVLEGELKDNQSIAFSIRFHSPVAPGALADLKRSLKDRVKVDTVFLTAETEVLASRYGTNRRKHPFALEGQSLEVAISNERKTLRAVERECDVVIDTSTLSPQHLARQLESRYRFDVPSRSLNVSITSFGFKHGLHRPVDSLFDVRFLSNPFFIPALRPKSGLDQGVRAFIFEDPNMEALLGRLVDLHSWILPRYYEEGKHYFRIGIGCTGGQHRSVAVAEELALRLHQVNLEHIIISVTHRDLQ